MKPKRTWKHKKSDIINALILYRSTRLSDGKRVWISGMNGKTYDTIQQAGAELDEKKK